MPLQNFLKNIRGNKKMDKYIINYSLPFNSDMDVKHTFMFIHYLQEFIVATSARQPITITYSLGDEGGQKRLTLLIDNLNEFLCEKIHSFAQDVLQAMSNEEGGKFDMIVTLDTVVTDDEDE